MFAIGRQRPGVAALVVRHLNYYEHLPETTLPKLPRVTDGARPARIGGCLRPARQSFSPDGQADVSRFPNVLCGLPRLRLRWILSQRRRAQWAREEGSGCLTLLLQWTRTIAFLFAIVRHGRRATEQRRYAALSVAGVGRRAASVQPAGLELAASRRRYSWLFFCQSRLIFHA